MDMTASIAETIERYSLIPPNQSVLVAVSGGPDSTALLHCLSALGYKVEAAHLNHQFRGAESDGDADYVSELCRALSVELTSGSIDVPSLKRSQKTSAQQASRSARYKFLEEVRQRRKLDLISTAHNLDDRVETVLLNIVRGTGVDGLRGIPYRRDRIIRPLLDTPRESILSYLDRQALSPRSDSSNLSSKYARNNVRSELLPYLERRFNPAVRRSVLRLSELAADESDYLNSLAWNWLAEKTELLVSDIANEPVAFQRRILREWFRSNIESELSDVSHALVEQFRTSFQSPCAVTLPGGRIVAESDGTTIGIRVLEDDEVESIAEAAIEIGCETVFGDYFVTVTAIGDGVDGASLHVRHWNDGDRITLTGGTRKVQDVFTDQKVPRDLRRGYPLLADKFGLVSIGDLRFASRARNTIVTIVRAD